MITMINSCLIDRLSIFGRAVTVAMRGGVASSERNLQQDDGVITVLDFFLFIEAQMKKFVENGKNAISSSVSISSQ